MRYFILHCLPRWNYVSLFWTCLFLCIGRLSAFSITCWLILRYPVLILSLPCLQLLGRHQSPWDPPLLSRLSCCSAWQISHMQQLYPPLVITPVVLSHPRTMSHVTPIPTATARAAVKGSRVWVQAYVLIMVSSREGHVRIRIMRMKRVRVLVRIVSLPNLSIISNSKLENQRTGHE